MEEKEKEIKEEVEESESKETEEIKESEEKEEKLSPKEEMKRSYRKELEKKDSEIKELTEQRNYYKNQYYQAYADMQNLRKSLQKDHSEALKYRAEGFIEKLLPVLDGFYMALANEPNDPALKNYLIGFQYIYNNFQGAMESEGAITITPKVGDKFDPSTMNAISVEETEGEENLVIKTCLTGLKLHDRIIRPASVVVSKKKVEETPKDDESLDA